jgi:hypothetical protein
MGKRRHQVFIAPGPDIELPIPPSPWHRGRRVSIFLEHWQLLLEFAQSLDEEGGALLRQCSTPSTSDDRVDLPAKALSTLSTHLERVAGTISRSQPIAPIPTEDLPEDYTNLEYSRMARAVRAVIEESRRLVLPFEAWIE